MPQPITTARARAGKALLMALLRGSWDSKAGADRPLERLDVALHHGLGTAGVAVEDRLQQLTVLGDRVVEAGDAVEREEPDAQREGVPLVQRRLDERVVRAAVDVAVDPLVELDQPALVARGCNRGQLVEEGARDRPVVVVGALGGEPRGEALERAPRLGERGEVADVDGGGDHPTPRVHLDELLLRERPQRLPYRGAAEPEPLHQLPLADRRPGRELEGD